MKYYLPFFLFMAALMVSCSSGRNSQKMSQKKASSSDHLVKESNTKSTPVKAKLTYKQRKYHNSAKHYDKVDDVTRDKSLANTVKARKATNKNNHKYKTSQAKYLQELNQSKYKNAKKFSGKFEFY